MAFDIENQTGLDDLPDHFTALAAQIGLAPDPLDGTLAFEGREGIASPHRLEVGMSLAIAAQACAVASLRQAAGLGGQDIGVNLGQAGHAVNPSRFIFQNGHNVGFTFTIEEPGNGYFQTSDERWMYLVSTRPGLRNGLLELLDCANTPDAIARAVARWTAQELEDACAARSLPVVMVRDKAEWRRHPQGQTLTSLPVVEITRIGDGDPIPVAGDDRPLAGVRVLDSSHILAGPGLARTLAGHGADALRVSAPRQTDPINFMIDTGFGKRAAFVDLEAAEGRAHLKILARDADVFVQSYSPGSLVRRGLGPEELVQGHRGLIYVSLSCFGAHGPWADRVGFDHNAQSVTGISAVEGGAGRPCLPPTTLVADYTTAYLGAAGTLAAMALRARDGGSYLVRLSLAQTCMWLQDLGLRDPSVHQVTRPNLGKMDSAFGELTYLRPVEQLSATPAHWTLPPQPLGAARAEWSAK